MKVKVPSSAIRKRHKPDGTVSRSSPHGRERGGYQERASGVDGEGTNVKAMRIGKLDRRRLSRLRIDREDYFHRLQKNKLPLNGSMR